MKKLIFFLLLSISANLNAQTIQNTSFEIGSDTSKTTPKFWGFTIGKANGEQAHSLSDEFVAHLDNTVSHSGKSSLKMSVSDTTSFVFACTQRCELHISSPKTIRIVAWLKTKDCKKGAGLNCTQKNSKGKQIGYTSSRQQEKLVLDTQEWTKTELVVLLQPNVKSIELMAFVYGAGTVWFDDISIEEFSGSTLKTAPIVSAYLDSVIKIVKENSLYKDSIDWKKFTSQLNTWANGMQTYSEANLLASSIVNELHKHGDNHSFFIGPVAAKQLGTIDVQGRGRKVEAEYLGQGIGYISMPGFGSFSDSVSVAFSTYTQKMIKKIDTENKICSWIVDLRDDDGGSCQPMIAGLGPILGEGMYELNSSYTLKGDTGISFYKNGEAYFELNKKRDSISTKVLNPYKLKNENVPVAVLIGKGCGSSGECTAAAFIGRHDTKLFGQPTAGFTKGNSDFTLADSSMIFISSGIQTDRNGKKYPDRIFPDVQVDEPTDSKTDVTLEKAKKWLVSFGECK